MSTVPPEWLMALLAPDRPLLRWGDRVLSALRAPAPPTRYDRFARAYDRLVGNAAYNRFVWRSSTGAYSAFAERALADGDGPLLELGCGTALFTADRYRRSERRLVLVDRSSGMLTRAAERLGDTDPERVVLLQADVLDLPFRPGMFGTVASYGLLHLFDDPQPLLRVLATQSASDQAVYATSLVAGTALAGPVLHLLHAAGESARPRRLDQLAALARAELGGGLQVWREGGMAYLHLPAAAS